MAIYTAYSHPEIKQEKYFKNLLDLRLNFNFSCD